MKKVFIILGVLVGFCTILLIFNAIYLKTTTTTKTYEISEIYDTLNINVKDYDVNIYFSQEDKVVSMENKRVFISTEISEGTMNIKQNDTRKFYERIINFSSNKLNLYLSKSSLKNLNIECSTGDLTINEGFDFDKISINSRTGNIVVKSDSKNLILKNTTGNIKINKELNFEDITINNSTGDIEVSSNSDTLMITNTTGNIKILDANIDGLTKIQTKTGDISLKNVTSKSLEIELSTGDTVLENVNINGDFVMKGQTGDVKLISFDAANIDISITTGDIKGTIVSEKIFITNSKTGNVSVPETVTGGICKLKTTTGNIRITYE